MAGFDCPLTTPETIPTNEDVYLRDEVFMKDYEAACLALSEGKEWKHVGYVTYVAVRQVHESYLELSWFHISDRFHELSITLPRDQIVLCVGSDYWDEKTSIFVKSKWLEELFLRSNAVFGKIDAINFTKAMHAGSIQKKSLSEFRSGLDYLASRFSEISFISFADSVILKSNWTVGYFMKGLKYTYKPEIFIQLFKEIQLLFEKSFNLKAYGILTQGANEYFDDPVVHISETKNHVGLNSLGAPFADLSAIEDAAKKALRAGTHDGHDLYLDELYFRSLTLKYEYKRSRTLRFSYDSVLRKVPAKYVCVSCEEVLENLEPVG